MDELPHPVIPSLSRNLLRSFVSAIAPLRMTYVRLFAILCHPELVEGSLRFFVFAFAPLRKTYYSSPPYKGIGIIPLLNQQLNL